MLCTSLKIWNFQFPLQDIVTESSSFDLVSFIPLLRDRIYTANPFAKQFLVSWVSAMRPSTAYKEINTFYWMVWHIICADIIWFGYKIDSWYLFFVQLMVLDAVPDLDLITHLPEFLDGLFNIFKDRNPEIRKMLVVVLFIWNIVINPLTPMSDQDRISPYNIDRISTR